MAEFSQFVLEWRTDAGTLERVAFDASVTEGYESSAEAAEHAVERGAAISDHVKPNADTLSVEGVVTNTPITTPATHMDGAAGAVRSATISVGGQNVSVSTYQFSQPFDRVRAVDVALRALMTAGQLLKVYTGLRVLEDLVIQRYKVDRDVTTGNALAFTLEFKKLRIASTQRVAAPRRVRRPQSRGPQPTQPADLRGVLSNLTGVGERLSF